MPPSSPNRPKYDQKTRALHKKMEEREDEEFVRQLISEKPVNVKVSLRRQSQSAKVFCSWECVKRYAMEDCPKQLRYERCMLIDLAAGFVVD